MKQLLSFVILVSIFILNINAQTETNANEKKLTKANLTGFVKDSESGEALSRATIQIMTPDTAKMVTGIISNNLGGFTIKGVNEGNYIVKVSYLGYHTFYRAITIRNKETIHNIGTIIMLPSSFMLKTAVVTATLQQVEVKEDTLIFNADAFKVEEGSVLEDLVKKLPGAQVDNEGNITINGKSIKKILVDGKEFFSGDKSVAMKNLPTEIIDKIKTYDKASDQERLTGIADGNEETVIDLTIKKGMKKGWFGNFNLGYGTKDQYANRIMLNRFQDNFQSSLITNLNSNGGGGMSSGRGNAGNKNHSFSTGLNLVASKKNKYELGGNVRYNARQNETNNRSASQNYITTTTTFSDRINKNASHNDNANAEFKLEWKLDSLTTLLIRPVFGIGNSASHSNGQNATFNQDPYDYTNNPLKEFDLIPYNIKVNKNSSGTRSFSNNSNISATLNLNHRFKKQGRNISFNANGSYNDSDGRNFNTSDVYYYLNDSTNLIYRFRNSPNTNSNLGLGFSYSEPILRNLILQLNYSFNYSYRKSNSDTYDLGSEPSIEDMRNELIDKLGYLPEYDVYKEYISRDLSNYTTNENRNQNINLQIRWNSDFITSSVGVQIQPQHQKIDYSYQNIDTIATRNILNVSPTVNFRYRFNRQNQLNFSYRGSVSQPQITDLFAITDDSNPLRIRLGNPDLKPSFSNNFSFRWNDYFTSTMQSLTTNFDFSNTNNNISTRTEYNEETGGSISKPMNINGNWKISGSVGFNTPLFSIERLMLNTSTSCSYNNNMSYLYRNKETLKNQTNDFSVGEHINLTYRTDTWDVRFNGAFNYRHQDNKYIDVTSPNTYDFSYGFESNGNFNNGWGYATNIKMSSRRGYASKEANSNELIWNAQVSYRFLSGRPATLRLQVFDILNQRSNFSRTINTSGRTDTWSNAVNCYAMLNFTYRFNFFGSAKQRKELRKERRTRDAYRAEAEAASTNL